MKKEIPLLTAQDVELRVAQVVKTKSGVYAVLLVYKNARIDMKILDDVFGPMNWDRKHDTIDGKLFCTVSIWDENKQRLVSKQDVGVPSNTEATATKGEASDAFKRASFNWGIGRELYSAPDIRVKLEDFEIVMGDNNKPKTYAKFYVEEMRFDKEQNKFTSFKVVDKDGNTRFKLSAINKDVKTKVESTKVIETNTPPFGVDNVCSYCHTPIKSPKVLDYAIAKYGKPVCYECQKKFNVA